MLPDLVSLVLFIRAVEMRSLSKAAEKSNIALAAASRRITLLEQRYNVQLLYRKSFGVEATPAGMALAQHARQMIEQAEKLHADLSDYAKGVKGHIRLKANTSAITQFLPADLAAFALNHPDVKVELEENRSHEIVQAVREGGAHIGVVMEGLSLDGLQFYEYHQDRLVAVVPRGHPISGHQSAFEAILDFDLVTLDSSAAMMRLLSDAACAAGQPMRLRVQVKSFEAVCKLVQAGLGIGILPETAALDFAPIMALRLIRLTDSWATRQMYVCIRNLETLPAQGRLLVQQLVGSRDLRHFRRPG